MQTVILAFVITADSRMCKDCQPTPDNLCHGKQKEKSWKSAGGSGLCEIEQAQIFVSGSQTSTVCEHGGTANSCEGAGRSGASPYL
jgi:hypothetical protein